RQVHRNAVNAVLDESVVWVKARREGQIAFRADDRSFRRIELAWVEHDFVAALFVRLWHEVPAEAAGERQASRGVPLVLEVEGVYRILKVLANLRAALAESGGVAEKKIGNRVAGRVPIEAEIGRGVSGIAILAMRSPEQRPAGLNEVLPTQPAPVVGHHVLQ